MASLFLDAFVIEITHKDGSVTLVTEGDRILRFSLHDAEAAVARWRAWDPGSVFRVVRR